MARPRRRQVDHWTLLMARPRRRRVDHWTLLTARPRRRQVDEAVDVAGQVGVAPGPAACVAGGVAHVRAPARLRLQLSVDMGRLRERASHAARGTVGLGEGAARLLGTAPHAEAAAAAAVSVGADDRLLQYLEAAPRTRSSAIAEGPRVIIIIIIIKGIYIAQVRKGHKCAMSAEMQYGYVTVYISIAISHITNCQDS